MFLYYILFCALLCTTVVAVMFVLKLKKLRMEYEEKLKLQQHRSIPEYLTNPSQNEGGTSAVPSDSVQKLMLNEDHYKYLFENIGDSIFIYDRESHKFLDCNEVASKKYGYSKEELLQMTPIELHVEEERDFVQQFIGIPSPKLSPMYSHISKNKEKIFVEIRSVAIKHFDKNALLAIVRDVTERKQAQDDIEEKNKRLWKTSVLINQQKEHVENLFSELEKQKMKLEAVNQEIASKNTKLWATSMIVNQKKEEVEKMKEDLAIKNKLVTDSIRYAKLIQEAMLAPKKDLNKFFPEAFIFFRPKDIVSGDFYWFNQINNTIVLAAVDCTGHGVPGAFMSMIGMELLNATVNEKEIIDPGIILQKVLQGIFIGLRQKQKGSIVKDGFDAALCAFPVNGMSQNNGGMIMQFAGLNNPLFIVRKGIHNEEFVKSEDVISPCPDLALIKPIKNMGLEQKKFISHQINVKIGDQLYIFSDGFADQFGGPKKKKFKNKQFQELIASLLTYPMKEQHDFLNDTFDNWKTDLDQVDDILVIGVKIT